MTGLFLLEKAAALGACMVPLLLGTLFISYKMHSRNKALGHYVNISQAAEVQREGAAGDVERLKKGHPVTLNQANLNRFRYKPKDDNLYLVAQDDRTDYTQPPMSDVFEGVLQSVSFLIHFLMLTSSLVLDDVDMVIQLSEPFCLVPGCPRPNRKQHNNHLASSLRMALS